MVCCGVPVWVPRDLLRPGGLRGVWCVAAPVVGLVNIGSVTAEIILIWTNVPRTNVAWTNVLVTVVICCICSQDPLFKV